MAVNERPDGAVLRTGYQYLVKLAPGGAELVQARLAGSAVPGQQVLWLALRPETTPRGRRMVMAAVDGQDIGELAQAGADTALAWLDREGDPVACLALAGIRDGSLRLLAHLRQPE